MMRSYSPEQTSGSAPPVSVEQANLKAQAAPTNVEGSSQGLPVATATPSTESPACRAQHEKQVRLF